MPDRWSLVLASALGTVVLTTGAVFALRAGVLREAHAARDHALEPAPDPAGFSGGILPVPSPSNGTGRPPLGVPVLDARIARAEDDPARAAALAARVRSALPAGAQVQDVSAACAGVFCRVKLVKPRETPAEWQEIHAAMQAHLRGELLFQAERGAVVGTAYAYVADPGAHLPLMESD
jgi:hypothetical protein